MVLEEHSDLELAGIRFQIGIFEEALATDPTDTDALRYLAHAYTIVGRANDGLNADRRLVGLLPSDSRVRYNLACSCALAGRGLAASRGRTRRRSRAGSGCRTGARHR